MIVRFTDIDGNIFLVPLNKVTFCELSVCGDSNCNDYYHYNVLVDRIAIEVKREEFIRVFHWLAHENPGNLEEGLFEIPQQKDKRGKNDESTD